MLHRVSPGVMHEVLHLNVPGVGNASIALRLGGVSINNYRLAARCGDAGGIKTEWSFACPGNGIAVDCCSLLTSVLALEVVATFIGAVALIGGVIFSVHPPIARAMNAATNTKPHRVGKDVFGIMKLRSC